MIDQLLRDFSGLVSSYAAFSPARTLPGKNGTDRRQADDAASHGIWHIARCAVAGLRHQMRQARCAL